ncbi:carboxypeptidase inhibitor SmCI-like [Amphibalanus amphitrite]|uniref:carboxypeptidase inhibitor SmCI-like n=1 Tax=Amphibalanus amphitrite TaxID=1232801 RepID=UPI001C903412|nr:carboxypeptidase inhibitor SmCI-like [Amphibalanus amphitrite]
MPLFFTIPLILVISGEVHGCAFRPMMVSHHPPCAGHEDSAAICSLPVKAGDCRGVIPRYFYNTERSTCMEFNYSGCGGNGNNFETLHDCEKMCTTEKAGAGSTNTSDCSSAPDGGLCMAYMERYAFNPSTGSCEKFVYGGCGGNGNRYSSVEECEEHCGSGEHNSTGEPGLQEATSEATQQEQQDVNQTEQPGDNDVEMCLQPKVIGPCRASEMRFYFNAEFGVCQVFLYGGCGGNANNFETIDECIRFCEEDDAYKVTFPPLL